MTIPTDPFPNFVPGTLADADQVDARFKTLYDMFDPGQTGIDIDNLKAALQALLVPTGTVLATARSSVPSGGQYLMCDGSPVSRSTYAALFTAIGTTYGTGDGSTTFNLPDLRGRVPVGVDGAAGRLAANDALGNSAGEEKHTLIDVELPSYGSGVDKGHGSYWGAVAGVDRALWVGGNDQPHNNMQPYQVVNWMIKV